MLLLLLLLLSVTPIMLLQNLLRGKKAQRDISRKFRHM
jgi:hypothetical protein